ncbi:MAG: M20/M25/M40 family metallo-hydrolase [Labilithrix sp.]|nr:M20/M25/M40 family metallo-hydrolase [Labilithrix sp.]
MRRALAITLALFGLVLFLAFIRYGTPAPAPEDAPRDRFSAMRAAAVQENLVGDGATRFVGTPGNARGRAVIVAELKELGWTVETQTTRSCTYHGTCAPVANVVAHLPGREPALPGVLLTAHYDSVPVSPGASDDGLGVATLLETARALVAGPRPRRTVVAVFTDGEEAGLLGADAFVREHPLAGKVRMTVNVDSRGSHGPSQMFETSRGNAWLVAFVAERVERPVTTSLFYEVYRRMPNDTDFSVTKTIASGVNFANTAGIEHYHTPLDTVALSDVGTLQHHGDNVLAMARALADSELAPTASEAQGDAVWFDVFALGVVRWPERWSLLLALVGLSLVVGHTIRARAWDRGLAVFLASFVPGALTAVVVGLALRACGAFPALWIAHPRAALSAIHWSAAATALGVALGLARRASPRSLWAGTWIAWGALGVLAAWLAPGASYLFVVPTLVAAIAASLPFAIACVAPAVAAATLVLALAVGLYEALGFAVAPLAALPTLLLATTLAPMLPDAPPALRRLPVAFAITAVGSAILALAVPKFTAEVPQRANVVFRQDDDRARVFVDTTWGPSTWGSAPAPMLDAIGGPVGEDAALPWTLPSVFAEVPRLDVKAPSVEALAVDDAGGRHHVRARLRSQRGADTLAIVLPGGRHVEVKVEGRFAVPRAVPGGSLVGLFAVPPEGVVIELDAPSTGPIAFTLVDRSFGVPDGTKAAAAVAARPAAATPFQDGDVTVMTTPHSL